MLTKNYSTYPGVPIGTWRDQEGIPEPILRGLVLNHQVLGGPEAKTLSKAVIFYQIYEVHAICAAAPCRLEVIVQMGGGFIKYFLFLFVGN